MNAKRNKVRAILNVVTSCKDYKEQLVSEESVEDNVTGATNKLALEWSTQSG